MRLELTSFVKAVARLEQALAALRSRVDDSFIGDAVIQRFEFTYEMTHKMLKRYLEMSAAAPQAFDEMAFQQLIRIGNEQGLLRSGWDKWKEYRRARGATSHTYDEEKAREVLALVPDFLEEARYLLERLQARAPLL